jgi:hypothetical protein
MLYAPGSPAVQAGSKSGSPSAPSHLKWIWTEESEKRSPLQRNLQPICS